MNNYTPKGLEKVSILKGCNNRVSVLSGCRKWLKSYLENSMRLEYNSIVYVITILFNHTWTTRTKDSGFFLNTSWKALPGSLEKIFKKNGD